MRWTVLAVLAVGCAPAVHPEDADGDGAVDGEDCAPNDPRRFPGNPEVCNGVDDDCDGSTAESGASTDGEGFATIQAAIDAAAAGGTVSVCAGTYVVNLVVERDLVLTSADGADHTRLDGGGAGSVIRVQGGADLTLRELTVAAGAWSRRESDGARVGGGLFAPHAGALTIEGSAFVGNGEGDHGGAIAVSRADRVTITDSMFTDNLASVRGGAVDLASVGHLRIDRTRFSRNAALLGTALALRHVEDCELTELVVSDNVPFDGVYAQGTLHLSSDCTLRDSLLVGNVAGEGGGLAVNNAAVSLIATTLRGNVATWDGGGAMVNAFDGGEATLRADAASVIEDNVARSDRDGVAWGGGVSAFTWGRGPYGFTRDGGPIRLEGLRLERNVAWGGGGGGVYHEDLSGRGELSLDGVEAVDNTTQGGGGGGALLRYVGAEDGPSISVRRSTFRANSATGPEAAPGGGLSVVGPASFVLADATVESNVAPAGGGLQVAGATACAIRRSVIHANAGGSEGGGIAFAPREDPFGPPVPPACTLVDSEVNGNRTDGSGGGIATAGSLVLRNARVSGNTAASGGGVALSDALGSPATVDADPRSFVKRNTAATGGGLLARPVSGAGFLLTRLSVMDNRADRGGGLALPRAVGGACAELRLDDAKVDANSAVEGGGLYVECSVIVDDTSVRANAADAAGGGARLEASGALTSIGSRWGTGPADNTPDDLLVGGVPFEVFVGDFSCDASVGACPKQ